MIGFVLHTLETESVMITINLFKRKAEKRITEVERIFKRNWLPILNDAIRMKKSEEFLRIWGAFEHVEPENVPTDKLAFQLAGVSHLKKEGFTAKGVCNTYEPSPGIAFTALDIVVHLPKPAQE